MKTKNLFLRFILPVFTCFLSLAAVIIGAVALAKAYEEPKITGISSLNYEFFNTVADTMFVYKRGTIGVTVTDKEDIEEIQSGLAEVMEFAVCSPTSSKVSNPDDNSDSIQFFWENEDGTSSSILISIIFYKDSMKLKIGNGSGYYYYYSDCVVKVRDIIFDAKQKYGCLSNH